MEEFPISFKKTSFKRITTLPINGNLKFFVNISHSGAFEIMESGSLVVSGIIEAVKKENSTEFEHIYTSEIIEKLNQEEFYKEFRLRRYYYKECFRGIKECDLEGNEATIEWMGKFDCFVDSIGLISLYKFSEFRRDLYLPTYLSELIIDPKIFLKAVERNQGLLSIIW